MDSKSVNDILKSNGRPAHPNSIILGTPPDIHPVVDHCMHYCTTHEGCCWPIRPGCRSSLRLAHGEGYAYMHLILICLYCSLPGPGSGRVAKHFRGLCLSGLSPYCTLLGHARQIGIGETARRIVHCLSLEEIFKMQLVQVVSKLQFTLSVNASKRMICRSTVPP